MAHNKMQEAVSRAQKALQDAQYRFDSDGRSLQYKASGSIDLFGGSATSRVAEIAGESRRLCDALYTACQTQVVILDEICRPLLSEDTPVSVVQDVWQTISKLNEESEITNNFTASLNSQSLGDVATVNYYPSIECKMIESYWESKYKNWPGRVEYETNLKAEKQKKEADRKKAAAQRKDREAIEYKEAEKKWQETAKTIEAKREAAMEGAMAKERTRIEKKIKDGFEKETQKQAALKKDLEQQRAKAEEFKAELRFYQFLKKMELNNTIEDLAKQIAAAEQAMTDAKQKHDNGMRDLEKTLQRNKAKVVESVNKQYPLPRKPRKPLSMTYDNPSPMMMVTEGMKQAILETLEKYDELSYQELIDKCPAITDMTLQRVDGMVKALEREGEITIKRRKEKYGTVAYCSLAY